MMTSVSKNSEEGCGEELRFLNDCHECVLPVYSRYNCGQINLTLNVLTISLRALYQPNRRTPETHQCPLVNATSIKQGRKAKLVDSNYASVILRELLASKAGNLFLPDREPPCIVRGFHGTLPPSPNMIIRLGA